MTSHFEPAPRTLRLALRSAALALAVATAAPLTAAAQDDGFDLASLQIPDGFLELSDVTVTGRQGGGTSITAMTTLMEARTYLLLASSPVDSGPARRTLGLRPDDWSLTRSIPALSNPALDDLRLSNVGLVITQEDVAASWTTLSPEEYGFYRGVFGRDEFQLTLKPGINLIAVIPLAGLAEDSPLLLAMNALGMERGDILLQGTLGRSLGLIRGQPGGAGALRDLFLRAELPKVSPPGAPAWFKSGQLALELTGDPAVRLAGELTVQIEDDILLFRTTAGIARTGMSLTGGLASDGGWEQPFGIEWMTLNAVILKVGITPAGSLQLGFAGDLVIGEKDMAVAVAVALNMATGVPTNFIFEGESDEGFGMPDLVALQTRMAGDGAKAIPLEALPQIAFTDVGLKFAPKPEPDLGVERGMAIKGRLWLQTAPQGELVDFAGVDVSVGEEGLAVKGDIGALTLGPLALEETVLDLAATADAQHFILRGRADLLGSSQLIDVGVTRDALAFTSRTRLFDLFSADLSATAAFDLRRPAFQVAGVVHNDFGEAVAPLLMEGFGGFAANGESLLENTAAAVAEFERLLANQTATVAEIRAAVEAQRAQMRAALNDAERSAASAGTALAGAERALRSARSALQSSPRGRPAVRAQRAATVAARRTDVARARARYIAAAAVVTTRRQVLDALPPADQAVAVVAAEAVLEGLRTQVATSRDRLSQLSAGYTRLVDALESGQPQVTFTRAAFNADLEAMLQGQAFRWDLAGTYIGRPFAISRDVDFGNPGQAAADIVAALVGT